MKRDSKPNLFFRDIGQGKPLVLLHGLAVNGDMFLSIIDKLSLNHRLIVPDLRGHGRSENLPGPYSPGQMAEDVVELLDFLGIGLVDILGYSEGGAVAQQLAKDDPSRVRKLILVCTFAYNVGTLMERIEAKLSPLLARIIGVRRLVGLALRFSGGPKLSSKLIRQFYDMLPTDADKIAEAIQEMNRFDSRSWLNQISAKTLIIAGSNDKAVPAYHAETLARGIRNSKLKVIEGAGHPLILTHADKLTDLIKEFLLNS